ncbi:uncharacterized protein LOC132785081 [Drosophila nasuta]|uniref:uncharacterized protein LOC132785081 n=1 Tax=Drosophila nasuta TaxID=42062 RepID=UPI00295E6D03|nr:uncharacterized protein LOC132785081 [Drosophila nasuta]
MSLSSIKQKEFKGKKKTLPKLRTILANPYKQHSPVLPENEVLTFRKIMKNAISCTQGPSKAFATKTHIHLGLESSLRAINGARFSCVFISLSIRPSHLLRLIATSAVVKVPTAPIYAQPKLEDLTEELFGIRSLILVLPLDLDGISLELSKWVNAHKKKPPAPPQKIFPIARKSKPQVKLAETIEVVPQIAAPLKIEKEWSGDYISCMDGGALKLHLVDAQVEAQQLDKALSNIAMKTQLIKVDEPIPNSSKKETIAEIVEHMQLDETDDDEFLPASELSVYRPVTVHQIRPNPDKKPKKKRNKKSKTNNSN